MNVSQEIKLDMYGSELPGVSGSSDENCAEDYVKNPPITHPQRHHISKDDIVCLQEKMKSSIHLGSIHRVSGGNIFQKPNPEDHTKEKKNEDKPLRVCKMNEPCRHIETKGFPEIENQLPYHQNERQGPINELSKELINELPQEVMNQNPQTTFNHGLLRYSCLLKKLAYLLEYFRFGCKLLFELLEEHYLNLHINSDGLLMLEVIEEKQMLATKWSKEICAMENEYEIKQIFHMVCDFVDLDSVHQFVILMLEKYPFNGLPNISDEGFIGVFVGVVFSSNYQKEVACLIEFVARDQGGEKGSNLSDTTAQNLSPRAFSLGPSPEESFSTLFNTIKSIEEQEPSWRTDQLLWNRLKLRIEDIIVRGLNLISKYEQNYEVGILRVIWDRESGYSPNSFNETECLMLDITDMTIFHLDTIPTVTEIICDELSILNIKNTKCAQFIDILSLFLANPVIPFIDSLIAGGTIGLSKWQTFTTMWEMLRNFFSLLSHILHTIDSDCQEKHGPPLNPNLEHYLEVFEVFSTEVGEYVNQGIDQLNLHLDVFSENEDHLRDAYFQVYAGYYKIKYTLAILKLTDKHEVKKINME